MTTLSCKEYQFYQIGGTEWLGCQNSDNSEKYT